MMLPLLILPLLCTPACMGAATPTPSERELDVMGRRGGRQLLDEDASFYSTFRGNARDLLPFNLLKQEQFKRALLRSLNLGADYSAAQITVTLQGQTRNSVTLLTTLAPTEGVPQPALLESIEQLPLFFRSGHAAISSWFKGRWCISTSVGSCTGVAVTPPAIQPGCYVDVCLVLDGSADIAQEAGGWVGQAALASGIVAALGHPESRLMAFQAGYTLEPLLDVTTKAAFDGNDADGVDLAASVLAAKPVGWGHGLSQGAIECKRQLMELETGHAMRIVILTTGEPSGGDSMAALRQITVSVGEMGIETVVVGMGPAAPPLETLEQMAPNCRFSVEGDQLVCTPEPKALVMPSFDVAAVLAAANAAAALICSDGECEVREAGDLPPGASMTAVVVPASMASSDRSSSFDAFLAQHLNTFRASGGGGIAPQIVNGYVAKLGQFPFVAFVVFQNTPTGGYVTCTGSLIRSDVLLTAAHCVVNDAVDDPSSPTGKQLRRFTGSIIGMANMNCQGNSPKRKKAAGIIVHPGYNPETMDNDVALVLLDRAEPVKNIKPINLASPRTKLSSGIQAISTGWGRTVWNVAVPTDRLMYTTLEARACPQEVPDPNICLGKPKSLNRPTSTCYGDSGGPSFIPGGAPIQVGITSGALNSTENMRCEGWSFHSSVKALRSWILAELDKLPDAP